MANNLALGLVIGGAVSPTVGAAFNTVENRIKKLEQRGNQAKVLRNTIGETMRLRDEWKKAHDSGAASASGLLRKLENNLDTLRKQGVQVGKLRQEYQSLDRVARSMDLKVKGHQQIEQGKAGLKSGIGTAVAGVGALAVPTKISADYQAIIRDIAIKAGVANKPQEAELTTSVIKTSQDTGMARNDVADLVNKLVGAGMSLDKALSYAPVAAKFAVGQGASGTDTANMIQALQQNAKITDPKVMEKALEAIAMQGQAGSFEASDMARWFPQLLAGMGKLGVTGMDSVSQLGAMLQVQMKTAGGSDEAANNLKNWMEKIGSPDVVKSYKDVGIDYQGSLNTGIQKGMSTLESSFALAQHYIEKTDPAKAKKMKDATDKISKEADPAKAKEMLDSLEQALRTGDLFADMQVKAALTAYSQNRALYEQLKKDSQNASGILDKNLAERRGASSQIWSETFQAVNDSMRSIGDAIRPVTDAVAKGITATAKEFTALSDTSKPVVLAIASIGAGLLALKSAAGVFKIGKGLLNLGRGSLGGNPNKVQKVYVTNSGGKDDKPDGKVGAVKGLLETGLKAFKGKDKIKGKDKAGGNGKDGADDADDDAEESGKTGFDPVDTGLKILDLFGEGGNDADGAKGGSSSEPQKVFVVNASAFGGGSDAPGDQRRSRRSRRRGAAGGAGGRRAGPPRPPMPPAPPVPAGRLARLAGAAGKLGSVAKVVPGAKFLDAGMLALDTYQNAETQDEKAEGYGGAAGGLAGALAGGAAGAAIGSIVPVIGTAIGGMVGAFLGGMGGQDVGGFLGKALFGSDEKAEAVAGKAGDAKPSAAPGDVVKAMAAVAPAPLALPAVVKAAEQSKPAPTKVDQQFTFSPNMPVNVQGDVKDPAQLARDIAPFLQRQFEEFSRQAAARQLFDAPHVG
ncbi:phage tail tape measure protein [Pseudomonas syringae pv. syringae]|uniref:phage tail tape measure protein n=1 Tax=Pseudomonas TaxID=286 RepID=UPI001F0F0B46|nr:phage tail tape measure protein [Pseudomonas syringae]MCH5523093.1 phage tail tape measure protein [Pseudomonas syringae pv. syringae]MCH5558262.1 phage tail tape measure protein [Pseudomonas syringae pv. syringae]MCH5591956.1 phage tail tape measure protein [Pseudomonas syringae pv. syringae]MCH5611374.1 phage tail tape measure protein [Pseudomonas syringae pv. syringae]MCH5618304.1 phage tail tape measure protein [Pseudomonas syringae pv. syringae]